MDLISWAIEWGVIVLSIVGFMLVFNWSERKNLSGTGKILVMSAYVLVLLVWYYAAHDAGSPLRLEHLWWRLF